jgi:fatty-acid desaturase
VGLVRGACEFCVNTTGHVAGSSEMSCGMYGRDWTGYNLLLVGFVNTGMALML